MKDRLRRARLMALGAFSTIVSAPLAALAQEFQKVEGKVVEEIPAIPFVAMAYGFIWIAVLGYVIYVARSLSRVAGEVEDLRRKLDVPKGPATGQGSAGRMGS